MVSQIYRDLNIPISMLGFQVFISNLILKMPLHTIREQLGGLGVHILAKAICSFLR